MYETLMVATLIKTVQYIRNQPIKCVSRTVIELLISALISILPIILLALIIYPISHFMNKITKGD
jgi:hypothetical protein